MTFTEFYKKLALLKNVLPNKKVGLLVLSKEKVFDVTSVHLVTDRNESYCVCIRLEPEVKSETTGIVEEIIPCPLKGCKQCTKSIKEAPTNVIRVQCPECKKKYYFISRVTGSLHASMQLEMKKNNWTTEQALNYLLEKTYS